MSQYADIIERLEKLEGPLLDGFKVRDLADLIPAVVHDAETSWLFGAALSGRLESLGAAIALVERMLPGAYREASGPRKYLNIPTPVPAKFRAEILANRGGFVGWHEREPIALLLAMFRAIEAGAKP